jgi:hypothetical protein
VADADLDKLDSLPEGANPDAGHAVWEVQVPKLAPGVDEFDFVAAKPPATQPKFKVKVPKDKKEGDTLRLNVPLIPTTNVTVPKGSKEGDTVKFKTPEGKEMLAKVPKGVEPGQTFPVSLTAAPTKKPVEAAPQGQPQKADLSHSEHPEHEHPGGAPPPGRKVDEVTIPEDKKPKDVFPHLPSGYPPGMRVNVTVPEGKKGGDKMQVQYDFPPKVHVKVPDPVPADGCVMCQVGDTVYKVPVGDHKPGDDMIVCLKGQ